jgi:hypothetical protein
MENPLSGSNLASRSDPQPPPVNTIDCHDEPGNTGMSAFRSDWKKAFLSRLRNFLITRSGEE